MQVDSMRINTPFALLPRHPLLRALALMVGIVFLTGLAAMGLLIGAAVLGVAALTVLVRDWLPGRRRQRADRDVIEAEFTIVPRDSLPRVD